MNVEDKIILILFLLYVFLLSCMAGFAVYVDCPGTEDDYKVCCICTLEKEWVEGNTRYFVVLDNGKGIQHDTRDECKVYER